MLGGELQRGCREILDEVPGSPNGAYLVSPSGDPGAAITVYCDMATLKVGSAGWMLLANVSNDSGSFWTSFDKKNNLINTTKGTASPQPSNNYILSLDDWRRFSERGRKVLVEITYTGGSYAVLYEAFRLDSGYNYIHHPGAAWQSGDTNDGVHFTGTLLPYSPLPWQCGSGNVGWWGNCGFSNFYQSDGSAAGTMVHPINASGLYVNPAVQGVSSKLYWMQ